MIPMAKSKCVKTSPRGLNPRMKAGRVRGGLLREEHNNWFLVNPKTIRGSITSTE